MPVPSPPSTFKRLLWNMSASVSIPFLFTTRPSHSRHGWGQVSYRTMSTTCRRKECMLSVCAVEGERNYFEAAYPFPMSTRLYMTSLGSSLYALA